MIDWENMMPMFFWGYTSCVTKRIIQFEYSKDDGVDQFHRDLINLFQGNGFQAHLDNKTVFEFYHAEQDITIYIGFYDWNFSVGFGVQADKWIEEKRALIAP